MCCVYLYWRCNILSAELRRRLMFLLCGWWTIQGVQDVQSPKCTHPGHCCTPCSDLTLARTRTRTGVSLSPPAGPVARPAKWKCQLYRWGEGGEGGTQGIGLWPGDWSNFWCFYCLHIQRWIYKYLSGLSLKLKQLCASYFYLKQTKSLISHNNSKLPTGNWLMLRIWWVNLQFLEKIEEYN